AKGWEDNWANIATFFDYPADIRKAIYTMNAVESVNSVIRRVIKKRNDDSVFKVIWLAIKDASKKWTMPIQN
ncbi:transposase, partial [Glaesserella parasuis]|nr:transposase [Glaesserella parasuis]